MRAAAFNDVSTNPQYQALKRSQSLSFGWQLSGAALNSNEVDGLCNTLSDGKCDKWVEMGLDLASLQGPICNSTHTHLNATDAFPKVADANSQAFSVALMNAFPANNKAVRSYLCDNLRYKALDNFFLNANVIIDATCTASNTAIHPEPFSAVGPPPTQAAIDAYQNARSVLYAWEYASQAESSSQLNQYCAHAPDYQSNWQALQLNATQVQETLCSFQQPISAEEGSAAMRQWTSVAFIVALENISNVNMWLGWLCSQLDSEGMDSVGLDGSLVKQSVCNDSARN
ncbi:Hypothetical predicted protein [Lecanosticta acicola]|uniref:Uncharacterized protein n=1 Tax=Lecanosticta acicola TaxID=111012 RepID=A0AAI8YUY4_9PEZI|nr:Hypothetical predicted protein [Lecanosticta acicola]